MGPTTEEGAATARLRAGVIGTGVIGQVMHLHFLRELADRYEIAAVCDISAQSAAGGGPRLRRARACSPTGARWWRATSTRSSSSPPAATRPSPSRRRALGRHVFTEKPMCFSTAEAREMIAGRQRGRRRVDGRLPQALRPGLRALSRGGRRSSPSRGCCASRPPSRPSSPTSATTRCTCPAATSTRASWQQLRADTRARLVAAIGTDDEFLVDQYQNVLLDTLVHEINTVRGCARRTGPPRLRRSAPRFADGRAELRERHGGDPLGRRARHDPLFDGVRDDGR